MPDFVDVTNQTLYPEVDNGMGMAGGNMQHMPPVFQEAPQERKIDGRTREGRAMRGRTPRTTGSAPPRKPGRPPGRKAPEDYRERILGVLQLVALPLAFKAPADGAAVEMHAPNIAIALNQLAQEQPEVAAVLDRILKVGPYGALLTAVLPLILQVAANHGAVPAGIMGTVPPDVLLAHYRAAMEAQMAAVG